MTDERITEASDDTPEELDRPNGPSRRSLLASAGAAVAGGVVLTGAGTGVAEAATGRVATGPSGSTVVEFRGRIAQTGQTGSTFTSYGFLTKLRGARRSDLFRGSPTAVGTALLTVYATGQLSGRVLDQQVHALDITGELSVYQRSSPGADFDHPGSFKVGRLVARFDVTLQDVLTVIAPGQGLPTLTGDMHQTRARQMTGGLADKRFGREGQRLRMFASGLGELIDPATLHSLMEVAGNWAAE